MAFEYLPGDTWIHHLDPRTKIFIWLTLLLVGMATTDPIWMIVLFIVEILILRSAKVHMKKVNSFLKSLVGVSIFYAIVNLIWAPLTNHEVKILFYLIPPETWPISIESIVWAVGAVMRFFVLSLAVRTVLMLTPTRDVIYALIKFGLPPEFGLAMTSAFGFLPEIISENTRIKEAQMVRGWEYESRNPIKRFKAIITQFLIPSIFNATRHVQAIAIAIESKGFGYNISDRTYMNEIKFKEADYIFVSFLLIVTIFGVLAGYYFKWSSFDFTLKLLKRFNLY